MELPTIFRIGTLKGFDLNIVHKLTNCENGGTLNKSESISASLH